MWTKQRIANLLQTNSKAVERAMVALLRRQTADERTSEMTRHRNRRGFTAAHAKKGTYFAKWVIRGNSLTGWHLQRAREIALHYTHQLADEANERSNTQQQAS